MYGYIAGKRYSFDPSRSIGKGGEADIFDLGGGLAGKVFKPPGHPDFTGLPFEQKAAELRLAEHQRKLRTFPQNLPPAVICPMELITDRAGSFVLGYTMQFLSGAELLLRYAQPNFRRAGVPQSEVIKVFLDLHGTVAALHAHPAKVVIGDFNDLNVLVRSCHAHLIDADSFSFGEFYCRVFTQKFVDPLLCDPKAKTLQLIRPHNANSDWYAFAVMLFSSLLFVDPYGGVYRPKKSADLIPHDMRPLRRITVFHEDVRYPKPATPYKVLPDDLLHYFDGLLVRDRRGVFPHKLLEGMRFTKCLSCGTEHARGACPRCAFAAPAAPREKTKIYGKVIVTTLFSTRGQILHAAVQNGRLLWLYHENGEFKREDGTSVVSGILDRGLRFRLRGRETCLGKGSEVARIRPGVEPQRVIVDCYGALPVFDANSKHLFWVESGQLRRDGLFGPVSLGEVLSRQTLFWTGEKLGFGFYRAGNLCVAFLFDPQTPGLNDRLKLPPLRGQLTDAYCLFGSDLVWFFVSLREGGKTVNQCVVIGRDGTVRAQAGMDEGAGGWLSTLRGNCAAGKMLFVPTDDGIVRVEEAGGQLALTHEFVETESFIDAGCQLHAGGGGIYVVQGQKIVLLKMKG